MSYQLTGKIKVINDIEQKSETFKVRTFVVTIDADSQYPQHISLQATNDKCDMLSTFTTGSDVTVSFNLRGREWTSPQGEVKYFNSLDAWRIEAAAPSQPDNSAQTPPPANQQPVDFNSGQQEDDLPF